jgi:cell division protein FtsW
MFLNKRGYNSIRQWWWEVDTILLIIIFAIMSVGALLITTASPSVAERIGLPSFHFLHRHMIFLFMAALIMFSFSYIQEKTLRKICLVGFLLSIALMALVPMLGEEVKGARRWISVAGIGLQPSEFLKPFMAVVVALILSERNTKGGLPGFSMVGLLYMLVVTLLLLQPDFGMSVSITVVTAGQLFLGGLSLWWICIAAISGVAGIFAAYFSMPHVAKRIDSFLHPEEIENYQIERSLEAYERGGFFGCGPGEGKIKSVLPDSHTDFIFAVAG